MPLGYERMNVKQNVPNKNIVFIKPLPGSMEGTSKDFLERVAAQCLPLMKKHHLAVVSLEEYAPNSEFLGRNFNSGEVIQLVLRSPSTGRWLPFKFVQMIMIHELAHIHQMNHSKKFWALRNEYATEMKQLWEKGYTGEGLWGKGNLLENGAFSHKGLELGEEFPKYMCGGTFRSRGKKRKAKSKVIYRGQKERWIRRKFGANGVTLGADDEKKVKLEKGKRPTGVPRVAGSTRGRELRAAAALARFEVKEGPQIEDEDLMTDGETESDTEKDGPSIRTEITVAFDINGTPLLDSEGRSMVKFCEDEDRVTEMVQKELAELQNLSHTLSNRLTQSNNSSTRTPQSKQSKSSKMPLHSPPKTDTANTLHTQKRRGSIGGDDADEIIASTCSLCSINTVSAALTCAVCSNVLHPEFVPNSWHCESLICKDSTYTNVGDVGMCGVCGTRKRAIDDT